MRRGFTLLEVLMAIAILGLGLSVLLGAQTGLFQSATRAARISIATGLARCKMSEVELELLQKGYSLLDQDGEGECCMDDSQEGFQCRWKVLRVELPEPPAPDLEGDGGIDSEGAGPLGGLLALGQGNGSALGDHPDMGAVASELGGAVGGGDGIASMVMGFVYPSLKPMLEASIRKVIVTVHWREGARERTLDVTQYLTNPQQALPDELDGGVAGSPLFGGMLPGAGTPAAPDPASTGTPVGAP